MEPISSGVYFKDSEDKQTLVKITSYTDHVVWGFSFQRVKDYGSLIERWVQIDTTRKFWIKRLHCWELAPTALHEEIRFIFDKKRNRPTVIYSS